MLGVDIAKTPIFIIAFLQLRTLYIVYRYLFDFTAAGVKCDVTAIKFHPCLNYSRDFILYPLMSLSSCS